MPMPSNPTVYVIAGPNGAGKTTFAQQYLPRYARCETFVNADIIAADLSPTDPDSQALIAGRVMLERIDELAQHRVDFGFETTLAGRSHAGRLRRLRNELGYNVVLAFIWLPSPELAVLRVAGRVKQGGHNIPEDTIRRRYRQGVINFAKRYVHVVDRWIVFSGADSPPVEIMRFEDGELLVSDDERFELLKQTTPEMIL
ncbi:zeta toxin family protein [Roseiconus lacunae]|uniref:zeta toxin family protein n=1 Tax=Roseiconus lacunae TaxID=2605694 RepID=UPI00308BEEB9|nr:zeta toxin family protein [Stieleria sp. HD01]